MEKLSYASESSTSPWHHLPASNRSRRAYLGDLAFWIETLRHPKRALIVDIPVQMGRRYYPPFRRLPRPAQSLAWTG